VLAAEAAAKDLPQVNLADALELTVLIARKDPGRYPRVAARWLQRLLEEDAAVTIEEAALAASSLVALTGVGHQEAAATLRAMAERATSRRRGRGVA
jgi:NAD(P)H-dependent FMN reductase